jgi:Spy/CpxP family protein refolding chaperone
MNRRKCFMVGSLALALVLASFTILPAAVQRNAATAVNRARIVRQLQMRQLFQGLDLTADQKDQIKNILKNNKTQILQAARNVVKGRLDVINGVSNGAGELAGARQNANSLRRSIIEQIKPVLTRDQLDKLQTKMQNRKQLRAQRLQNLLDRLDSRIGG